MVGRLLPADPTMLSGKSNEPINSFRQLNLVPDTRILFLQEFGLDASDILALSQNALPLLISVQQNVAHCQIVIL